MLPNRLIARAYLFRGALLWIVTRATITGVLVLAGGDAIRLSTTALAGLVLLVVTLGWIETRLFHERALLGNLGVPPLLLSLFFGGPALAGELALRLGAILLA